MNSTIQRRYRIRVSIFAVCAVLTLAALGTTYNAIQTLNRLERVEGERDKWQRPADVIQELNLREGSVVADLGSGVGYFALKLSVTVGNSGRVLAVDILRFPLHVLASRTILERLGNIDTILGKTDDPHLPPGAVDAILVANTYHELTDSKAIVTHLFRSLKPSGRLVILDRGPGAGANESRESEAAHHEIAPASVEEEILHGGFEVIKREDNFTTSPDHHVWWLIVARKR